MTRDVLSDPIAEHGRAVVDVPQIEPADDGAAARDEHVVRALARFLLRQRLGMVGGELRVATGKEYRLYFSDPALVAAVRELKGAPLRIVVTVASIEAGAQVPKLAASSAAVDAARERALANPEVQRFQELFPGSAVYQVSNLKES